MTNRTSLATAILLLGLAFTTKPMENTLKVHDQMIKYARTFINTVQSKPEIVHSFLSEAQIKETLDNIKRLETFESFNAVFSTYYDAKENKLAANALGKEALLSAFPYYLPESTYKYLLYLETNEQDTKERNEWISCRIFAQALKAKYEEYSKIEAANSLILLSEGKPKTAKGPAGKRKRKTKERIRKTTKRKKMAEKSKNVKRSKKHRKSASPTSKLTCPIPTCKHTRGHNYKNARSLQAHMRIYHNEYHE